MKWVNRLRESKRGPAQPVSPSFASSDSDLEQQFKELWEQFRAGESDKGKNPNAFGDALAAFCNLVRATDNGFDVLDSWAEARPFAFIVGRRLVSEIEQLRKGGPEGPLDGEDVLDFLAGSGEDSRLTLGPNLLSALEALVAPPLDVAPLVDAGLLSCLVAVLYRFLSPPNSSGGSSEPPSESTGRKSKASNAEGLEGLAKRVDDRRRRLSVEGSIVHIMKALAQHPSAAHSLVEDHSLQLLVCMVAVDMAGKGEAEMGKEDVGSPMRGERITPQLHKAQLRRHAMQVVHLLLASDSGAMPAYLRKHRLIERLVTVVKDFDPDTSDPTFAIGAVSLLVECIRLSSRQGSTVILREDFQAAKGYHWIAQLALKLTKVKPDTGSELPHPDTSASSSGPQPKHVKRNLTGKLGAMVANLKGHGAKADHPSSDAPPQAVSFDAIQSAARRLSSDDPSSAAQEDQGPSGPLETTPEKPGVSVSLSRLFDLIIELAQISTKPEEAPASVTSPALHRRTSSSGGKKLPPSTPNRGVAGAPAKSPPNRSFMPTWASSSPSSSSNNLLAEASRGSGRVKDSKAAQLLQEIFLETQDLGLRLEIVDRLLGLITGPVENKAVLEDLRTLPVLVKGMPEYPGVLQEELLRVLEYAGTVAGLSIEQELLSLVFFLQGPSVAPLGERFLSTCVRLLRFDPQYASTLRDCGLLDVLIEDLRSCGAREADKPGQGAGEGVSDAHKSAAEGDKSEGVLSLFEGGPTQETTWEALLSILRGSPENQKVFRKAGGFEVLLPLLGKSEALRGGALRVMGSLVSEDRECAHSEELGGLINVARTGHVLRKGGSEGGVPIQVTWQGRLEALEVLKGVLVENEAAREAFRVLEGFSLPLALLVGLRRDEGAGIYLGGGGVNGVEEGGEAHGGTKVQKRFERQGSELHPDLKLAVFEALLQVLTIAVRGNPKNRQALSEGVGSLSLKEALSMAGLTSPSFETRIVELFFALALETEPGLPEGRTEGEDVGLEERRASHQRASSSALDESHSRRSSLEGAPASRRSSIGKEGMGQPTGGAEHFTVLNPSAIKGLVLSLSLFSEPVQKQVLVRTKELALKGPRNQEVLCSAGLFGLLLEEVKASLLVNPPSELLTLGLELAEVLGTFRLSATELRGLLALVKPSADLRTSAFFLPMLERMAKSTAVGDTKQHAQNPSLAPFLDFSLAGVGHACARAQLHERAWPHSTGYSFACWVKFQNLRQALARTARGTVRTTQPLLDVPCLRLFTVGPADEKGPPYLEVAIECSGLLVLTAGPKERLVFTDFTFEEEIWYHIAVVHNKPSALAGLFQSSIASLYVDGVGRQTGKLAAAAVPPGRPLLATLGTPPGAMLAPSTLMWQLGSTFLFEEVLPPAAVFFMYALGRGYRGLFQDITLSEFLPKEVMGGVTLKVMQTLEEVAANPSAEKAGFGGLGEPKEQVAVEIVWDKDAAGAALGQLAARHMVFAFDGTQEQGGAADPLVTSEMVNLVDPQSSAASVSGADLSRCARLLGNVQVCRPCSLADSLRHPGGVSLLLALIQTAPTPQILRLALSLLVSSLRHNPKNAHDMARLRGYHLLAVFLRQHIDMVGHAELDLLLQLAGTDGSTGLASRGQPFGGVDDQGGAMHTVVLTDAPLVEDVLLDWTVWVAAPVPLQLAVLDFLESLAGHSAFRKHNLAALRRMDAFQHLLVTLQRGDVTEPVLQKAVRLLGLFIEDGKHPGELKAIADFVVSTFRQGQAIEGVEYGEPRKPSTPLFVPGRAGRESDGYEVLVRNMVLDKLLELQVRLRGEEELEVWGKIVGSRVVTFLLDEDVHPSTLCLVLTMLAVSISTNPASAAKFRASGGFQSITHVLPSFFDEPEVHGILLKLVLGRPVYPRQPAMGLEDFYALMPTGDAQDPVRFPELLEIIGSLFKAAFDAHDPHPIAPAGESSNHKLVAPGVENAVSDGAVDYSPRVTDSRGSTAEELATGLMQCLVKLAQRSPNLSQACRRQEFLEGYVELFFSCVRSHALDTAPSLPPPYLAVDLDTGKSTQLDADVSEYASFDAMPKSFDGSSDRLDMGFRSPLGGPTDFDHSSYASGSTFVHDSGEDRRGLAIRTGPRTTAEIAAEGSLDGASSTGTRTPAGGTPKMSGMQSPIMVSSPVHSSSPYGKGGGFNGDAEMDGPVPHGLLTDALLQAAEESPGAQAVLDLLAVVLADALVEQSRSSGLLDTVLDAVPLDIAPATAVVFHGLCLQRVIKSMSHRFEDVPPPDKAKWAHNLEALAWLLVDRFHLGAFVGGESHVAILGFLVERLQAANVDGKVEEATVGGGSSLRLLALPKAKGAQVEPHVVALLKNLNRMIMYTFLPAAFRNKTGSGDTEGAGLTVEKALKLILLERKLVLCQSNVDSELMACLAYNLNEMLLADREEERVQALEVWKVLLLQKWAALEELLVVKNPVKGEPPTDVLRGGFDLLLTNGPNDFFQWLSDHDEDVRKVLSLKAASEWAEYVATAVKFPSQRGQTLESKRRKEMGRRMKERAKAAGRFEEQAMERRLTLGSVRQGVGASLRLLRQDKYGWVLHAEREWQSRLESLVHERAIWGPPQGKEPLAVQWQLDPTEGPYRMRKKLQRVQGLVDFTGWAEEMTLADDVATPAGETMTPAGGQGAPGGEQAEEAGDQSKEIGGIEYFHKFSVVGAASMRRMSEGGPLLEEEEEPDDADSASVYSASTSVSRPGSAAGRSGKLEVKVPEGPAQGDVINRSLESSPRHSSHDDSRAPSEADKANAAEQGLEGFEVLDDGEHLIRPYLEPRERIKARYNCERVVGLDKKDGIFLIGELCLYVIEGYFINSEGRICEKQAVDQTSVLDRALGVGKDALQGWGKKRKKSAIQSVKSTPKGGAGGSKSDPPEGEVGRVGGWQDAARCFTGGHFWALGSWGGAGGGGVCRQWKLDNLHELLKRRYQLRPVALELFSLDGCNDLLVFHQAERDDVFKNLLALNVPRANSHVSDLLGSTISGGARAETGEPGRLFKIMARSFSKRWQAGEISNFQYLMHLNTLAGRGYNDLTQYPVFPWVLADYESPELDLANPKSFRRLDRPMGALDPDREEEFQKRFENWEDPDIPPFHYGSHYSSAGIVLYYLVRLPPFNHLNQQLQGGKFDHADRMFVSLADTWRGASQGNTADVKELIPEFYYLPEFLENRMQLDLGAKQSGEQVDGVKLPPWAHGSAREFVRKHREALESQYVSVHLHHWVDLIFGYQQQGKAAEEATNVFFYLTYEGAVDIDAVADPTIKASILAQINYFGQTPRQLFQKPHGRRKATHMTPAVHALKHYDLLVAQELKDAASGKGAISQLVFDRERLYAVGAGCALRPPSYSKYFSWNFADRSVRIIAYDGEKLQSTHEALHDEGPVVSGAISRDGRVFVTGANDGVVRVWHMRKDAPRGQRRLILQEALCAHTGGVTCLAICQTYGIVVSGSEDKTVVLWDLNTLRFVRQLAGLQSAITTVHVDDLTGEIVTGAGGSLCVWSINGDCLAAHGEQGDTCQAGEEVLSVTTPQFSDHVLETNLYISGHADGSIKLWGLEHRVVAAQIEQGARKVSRERRSLSLNVSALQQAAHAVAAVDKPPTFTDLATSSLQSPQPPPSPSLTIEDLLKDHIMKPVSEESEALPEEDRFEIGGPPGVLIHPRRRTSDGEPKQGFSPRTPRLHGGPEYRLVLKKVLTWHTVGVTALCVSPSLKQVFSGDRDGRVACWSLPEDGLRDHFQEDSTVVACSNCKRKFALVERRHHCCNCGRVLCSKCCSRKVPLEDLGYFTPVRVCQDCYELRVRGTSKVEGPLLAAQALIPKPTPKPEAVEGAPKRSKSPKKHSMLEKIGSTRW